MKAKTTPGRFPTRLAAVLTALLLTSALALSAQEEAPAGYLPYPQAFIGLQAGGQTTFTDYNNWKLITPAMSVSVGLHLTPYIGARLHVGGFWNKGGVCADGIDATYKYNHATTDLDVMLNVTNIIRRGNYHPLNVYLIGGAGFNYAWENEDVPSLREHITATNSRNRFSHNYRVGAMADYRIAPNWSVNLEVAGNSLSDRFNSKLSGSGDWQLTAQVGVAYRFGKSRKASKDLTTDIAPVPTVTGSATETAPATTDVAIEKPKPEPKPEPKAEPKPAPAPAPQVREEEIRRDIFFGIRQTEVTPTGQSKIDEVAEWLAKHPQAKVTVVGYADKETGNPAINARFASGRAEAVTKALLRKGIGKSRITTDSKGDTVQPFAENDRNRVTIIIANTGGEK